MACNLGLQSREATARSYLCLRGLDSASENLEIGVEKHEVQVCFDDRRDVLSCSAFAEWCAGGPGQLVHDGECGGGGWIHSPMNADPSHRPGPDPPPWPRPWRFGRPILPGGVLQHPAGA